MENLGAIDIANEAIEQAEKDYRKKIKDEAYERVEEICDLCEYLAEEFDAVDFGAAVSNVLSCIILMVDAPEMTFMNGRSDPFFKKLKSADMVSFSATKDNGIHVVFRVNNIWEGE